MVLATTAARVAAACITSLTFGSLWKSPRLPVDTLPTQLFALPKSSSAVPTYTGELNVNALPLESKPDVIDARTLELIDEALRNLASPPTGAKPTKLDLLMGMAELRGLPLAEFGIDSLAAALDPHASWTAWAILATLLVDFLLMFKICRGQHSQCDAEIQQRAALAHSEQTNATPNVTSGTTTKPSASDVDRQLSFTSTTDADETAPLHPADDHRTSTGSFPSHAGEDVSSETATGSVAEDRRMSICSFCSTTSDATSGEVFAVESGIGDLGEEVVRGTSSAENATAESVAAPKSSKRKSKTPFELKAWMEKKREQCEVVESEQAKIFTDARACDKDAPVHGTSEQNSGSVQARGRRRSSQELRALMEKKRDQCHILESAQEHVNTDAKCFGSS